MNLVVLLNLLLMLGLINTTGSDVTIGLTATFNNIRNCFNNATIFISSSYSSIS